VPNLVANRTGVGRFNSTIHNALPRDPWVMDIKNNNTFVILDPYFPIIYKSFIELR